MIILERICSFCGESCFDSGHTHHLIPRFFHDIGTTNGLNLDNYRIILCEKHHKMITDAWFKVFKEMNRKWNVFSVIKR